jgi:hypothetical protein
MVSTHLIVAAAAVAGVLAPAICHAQCSPDVVQTLAAPDGARLEDFGFSVAISGDTAIIGAYLADNPWGDDSGAAYIFTLQDGLWVHQATLTASDGKATDWFGYGVDIDGDTAVVGARGFDRPGMKDAGGAYVFVRSGDAWTEQAKLLAPDGQAEDQLGGNPR